MKVRVSKRFCGRLLVRVGEEGRFRPLDVVDNALWVEPSREKQGGRRWREEKGDDSARVRAAGSKKNRCKKVRAREIECKRV
eukprot:2789343-Pleurochrysis_carterae.AAC.1